MSLFDFYVLALLLISGLVSFREAFKRDNSPKGRVVIAARNSKLSQEAQSTFDRAQERFETVQHLAEPTWSGTNRYASSVLFTTMLFNYSSECHSTLE